MVVVVVSSWLAFLAIRDFECAGVVGGAGESLVKVLGRQGSGVVRESRSEGRK